MEKKENYIKIRLSTLILGSVVMFLLFGAFMICILDEYFNKFDGVNMTPYYVIIFVVLFICITAYFALTSAQTTSMHLLLFEAIAKKLGETYKEKEFANEDEMAKAREDLEAFKAYDDALVKNIDDFSEYDSESEKKVYEYTHRIGDKDSIIDFFAPKDSTCYIEPDRNQMIDIYQYGISFRTSNYNSRLVLVTKPIELYPDALFASPKESFDDAFKIITEGVKEFDKKHVDYYKSDILNREYEQREEFLNGNYEFIELDLIKKNMLFDISKESNCEMTLVIEGGIGRCYISYYKTAISKFKDPEELGSMIADEFKKIISEFSY